MKQQTQIDFYRQTSVFTDYGRFKQDLVEIWRKRAKKDLKALCNLMQSVTIHRVIIQDFLNGKDVSSYGDFSHINFKTKTLKDDLITICEDDILVTAAAMLNEIYRRNKKGLYIGRPVQDKIIVTCRYVSVLTCAILKANNIPCRSRAGWATYFPGKKVACDHWVNEYWDKKTGRWVMFDLDDIYDQDYMQFDFYKNNGISDNYADFGEKKNVLFASGAQVWLDFRRYGDIIRRGLDYGCHYAAPENILEYLFYDFLSLMNYEVNYTFVPLAFSGKVKDFSDDDLKQLDDLATLLLDPDRNFRELCRLYESEPRFRMLNSPLVGSISHRPLVEKYNLPE